MTWPGHGLEIYSWTYIYIYRDAYALQISNVEPTPPLLRLERDAWPMVK